MTVRKWLLAVLVACGFLAQPLSSQSPRLAEAARSVRAAADPAEKLRGIDDLAVKAMAEWKVPGLAIAVVKDGTVIFSKGYGFRDAEKKLPVTPNTLFAIGSITKSFTSLTFAMLNDEHKVDWDKPVRQYLPEFTLYDEVATERATPRDLFSHRTGLPRHDLVWYFSNFSRPEILRRARYLKPSKDFRTTYQYQNIMMMTMGIVEERITGKSWEDNVRERIFGPLDMPDSNFSVRDMERVEDHALGYDVINDVATNIPYHFIDPIGPAGSINSSVADMSHYVIFHLGDGTWQGKRLVSEANLRLVHSPQTIIPDPAPDVRFTEIGHTSYALAWFASAYRGHSLVHHAGGIDGFNALLSILPDDHIGVIVLTNLSSQRASDILTDNVFDRLLDLNQIDWLERFKTLRAKNKQQIEEAKKKKADARKSNTHPSHELADFTGSFEHSGHGILKVTLNGGKLQLTINDAFGPVPLDHYHYDCFQISQDVHSPLAGLLVQFQTDKQGAIGSLSGPFEPDLGEEIVFQRVSEKHY
jgi:CubicO group peptidase (beta-lactamase class C family)